MKKIFAITLTFALMFLLCTPIGAVDSTEVQVTRRGNPYTIVDHTVYELIPATKTAAAYYNVCSLFDGYEALSTMEALSIRAEIDGIPVKTIELLYEDEEFNKGRQPFEREAWNIYDLSPVEIDGELRELGNGYSVLKSVTIPAPIDKIGASVFSFMQKLETVSLPNTLTQIGASAFSDCLQLKEIALPKRLTSIAERAFAYSGLQSVKIPKNVKTIGNMAFTHCKDLSALKLVNGIETIGTSAFAGTALTAVKLPATLKTVGDHAFMAASLEKATVLFKNPAVFSLLNSQLFTTFPDTCLLIVKTAKMKQALVDSKFNGTVKVKTTVSAPKKLAAKQKGNRVFLKWTPVAKATGYRVYRYNAADKTYSAVKTVKGANSVLLKPAKSGTYRYAVKAFRTISGDTSWSDYTNLVKVAYTK